MDEEAGAMVYDWRRVVLISVGGVSGGQLSSGHNHLGGDKVMVDTKG